MAAVVATSWTLHLLALLLLVATDDAAIFEVINYCPYTVWPAATPVGGGTQLNPGETWSFDMPAYNIARVWGRTGCLFNQNGSGSCQTGDCGGVLKCSLSGRPPLTIAEYLLNESTAFYDISVVNGFNLAMDFMPTQGGRGCKRLSCMDSMCPDAHTKPGDQKSSSCPLGTNYQVIFCPRNNLTCLPTTTSPQRALITMIAPSSPITVVLPSPKSAPATITEIAPSSPNPPPATFGQTSMKSSKGRRVIVILTSVGGFIFLILFTIIFTIFKRRTRHREMEQEEEEEFGDLQGTPMRFTFQQLKVATEQFRDKLGEGGFGSVFKGQFGEERIAVKRLDRIGQGKREFSAEVQTISRIHHINLVRLIGFCVEKSHRLLVYEYMPKGSLDRWIYHLKGNNAPPLDWQTRCKIITQVAKGLSYLHEDCTKRIAHLDVKPQNILLDESFNAKLSDFGLCKLIDRDKSQVITRMRGTPGYLAPEWLTSQITEKADVYSFGVMVMEIISGRKNLDTSRSEQSIHLITLLEEKVQTDQLVDLIDMQVHKQEAVQMMKLAMWCLQIDCKRRPQMSEVVKVLEGGRDAEANIDHIFVAKSSVCFGVAGNECSSAPPLASDVSGPR